jgi:hypothetical protein
VSDSLFSTVESPELIVPPSQQKQGNFWFYERIAVEDAERTVRFNSDALAIGENDFPSTMTAKIVLEQYLTKKRTIGVAKTLFYGERRCADGVRKLLSSLDFCCDVELCARRSLKRPLLLLAFIVLFEREDADFNHFSQIAPHTFDKMLLLLGSELRRRKIKALGSYLDRPTRKAK